MSKPGSETTPEPETYNDMQREVSRLLSNMPMADYDVRLNLVIAYLCSQIDKLKMQREDNEIVPTPNELKYVK